MIYSYKCPQCNNDIKMSRSIDMRDYNVRCKCGSIMNRLFTTGTTSRLIGIRNATKRDGVGVLIDEYGTINEPLTRGFKKL